MKILVRKDGLTILVTVAMMTDTHSFRSQDGIGSVSDCLLGLLTKILETSDSEQRNQEELLTPSTANL